MTRKSVVRKSVARKSVVREMGEDKQVKTSNLSDKPFIKKSKITCESQRAEPFLISGLADLDELMN